uniref:Uncharacterized protein n=1 Tax=Rhizophora mucronata TaxID=61149 RepID=A0A2P2N5U4_RHIMU
MDLPFLPVPKTSVLYFLSMLISMLISRSNLYVILPSLGQFSFHSAVLLQFLSDNFKMSRR